MNKKNVLIFIILVTFLTGCNFQTITLTPASSVPVISKTPSQQPVPSPTQLIASPVQPVIGLPTGTDGFPWWNDTVFYEIFVRSFKDSNGDGIGDFNGITQKLDYLQSLGITGIWLMPIFPSPSYHGYDVTDYLSVNPEYGTLDDFKSLLSEAHKRGIRVIIDLVLNHTSGKHPWFIAAQDPKSPYRNYYIWSNTNPNYTGPWNETVWYETETGWYYAIFPGFMPDLNFNNSKVTQDIHNAAKFWLSSGVDGFRVDAAKYLVEVGTEQENTTPTHEWYRNFRPFYKGINPDALTVGEIAGDNPATLASYTEGDQLDLTFDFGQAKGMMDAALSGQNFTVYGAIKLGFKLIPHQQYATFLTNHDQDRSMSQFKGNVGMAKAAATMLLTSPGVPFIYYGEEIGMLGVKPDEDIRRPMQWSGESNAGFTAGTPWRALEGNYQSFNVAVESGRPGSLLNYYISLIHLRNQHAALRIGDFNTLRPENPGIFASLRVSKFESVIIIVNLTPNPISDYSLSITKSPLSSGTYSTLPILGSADISSFAIGENGAFSGFKPLSEIPGYGYLILQFVKKSS